MRYDLDVHQAEVVCWLAGPRNSVLDGMLLCGRTTRLTKVRLPDPEVQM